MSTDTAFSSIDIEFWADIDGTEVECVQTYFTYALNSIPEAKFIASVGRDVHTGEASTAHKLAATKIMTPVKLYARFKNNGGVADAAMPVGQKLGFDGYVRGVGMSREVNSYGIAFDLIHWLSDLTYGSVLSSTSHPRNPADLAFRANWGGSGSQQGEGGRAWAQVNFAQEIITADNVEKDLWGSALKPWFLALLTTEDGDARDFFDPSNVGNATAVSREKVTKAINKIKSDPKLALEIGDSDVAKVIASDLTCSSQDLPNNPNSLEGLATTDFWSLLVNRYRSNYMFTIVPFPDKAKLVPFIEGYRTHFQGEHALNGFSVAARDLGNISITNRLRNRLGAYAVYGASAERIHGEVGQVQTNTINGIYKTSSDEAGIVMMQHLPRWLSESMGTATAGPRMGLSGNTTANGVAHPGNTGTEPPPEEETAEQRKKRQSQDQAIIDKYAHALYCNEVLLMRYGSISGPLRLDICPGSTIKFEGVTEKYTPGTQPVGNSHFAHVVRVTCVLDAQNGKASTVYDISHVRTEEENADDDTSITGHPLYSTTWSGDALI